MTLSASAPRAVAEMAHATRIPADVEREDRVLANLTARQLALLTVTGLVLYGGYAATRTVLPLAVFAALAAPLALAAVVVALGSRDGLSLDRLLVAALRQRLAPRLQLAGGITPAPAWLTENAATPTPTVGRRPERVATSPLELPAHGISEAGVVDLGADGRAVVCACSTVNFSLRTPGEQEALVAAFGRYLHSLTAPLQILIRAGRLDLAPQIAELREHVGALPHPALEAAALAHADYLAELAGQSDLLRRQVLLVLREPTTSAPTTGSLARARWRQRSRDAATSGEAAQRAAESRLARRVAEATTLLAAAGVTITPLDAGQATAVLAGACNPETLLAPTAGLAAADDIITIGGDVLDATAGEDARPTFDTATDWPGGHACPDGQTGESPAAEGGEAWWSA